ncbi:hypothetical protein DCO58_08955 [Helicobacter saguini]|uniref:TonB C-terminal domain-containing protein n=1 Tax=Helicobacter saguini TaxID=1548018 RepID=A0A347VP14_9HELI|nr:hypothetical protein [Helicobacter saguini]MWV61551.1 hypothetical protein [Helicobacter saguini]MWV67779.1 hypothetical protein [Helicobacter saguini]MWV70753.1 hypothetical protein [Helicobacter saguini]MWV72657.1 hypothetical protein [Helicobacter saguini]TLD94539.1 hypothetical protein LS64_005055 [Helicobacter saguini]
MDLVLAMLASNSNAKIEDKRWSNFPQNVQKKLEVSQNVKNFALYRYLVNSAIRYPKEWIENKARASVIASVAIYNQDVILKNVRILSSSEGLNKNSVVSEVKKTFKRASSDFPNTQESVEIDLPLEWRS